MKRSRNSHRTLPTAQDIKAAVATIDRALRLNFPPRYVATVADDWRSTAKTSALATKAREEAAARGISGTLFATPSRPAACQ